MTCKSKILSLLAIIWALPTGLLHAQSYAVRFTTPFPFYVANQKMPAGSYTATKPNINDDLLLIRGADWTHSAFVLYNVTQSFQPVAQGLVTFHQYGDADYLSSFTMTGQDTGMRIPESIAEEKAAQTHPETASTKSVGLQFGVPGY
jgi:hypothetical protein